MLSIDENRLSALRATYADTALETANPMMARTTYRRSHKMSSPCFTGRDIEAAYEAGYRQAWEDKHEVKPDKEYYGC